MGELCATEVALKVLDKRHIVRERKVEYVKLERLILDQLAHPGVVRLLFTFQDDAALYMGLECCDGGDLFQQVRKRGALPVVDARFYAAEIVDVLEYIHSQGPENVLLTREGHVKLCDFGSAKLLRPLPNGMSPTLPSDRNSSFVGTADYVSPEVLNSQPVTTGADLWALGCVVYQMLAGRPPFQAASEYLCFQRVMARDLYFSDSFDSDARDLVDRLLTEEPSGRLGAGGYAELKAHPFFTGVDWADPRKQAAPELAQSSTSSSDDADEDEDDDDDWELAQLGRQLSQISVVPATVPACVLELLQASREPP
eukprot:SM000049S16732  [mRNA]  locus=s49:378172:380156:- [translate_table: standard]